MGCLRSAVQNLQHHNYSLGTSALLGTAPQPPADTCMQLQPESPAHTDKFPSPSARIPQPKAVWLSPLMTAFKHKLANLECTLAF